MNTISNPSLYFVSFIKKIENIVMKNKFTIFLLILLISYSTSALAGKIVYPWRSTTAIVLAGGNFEVWFDAEVGENVSSIELKGRYNTVQSTISIVKDDWVYDPLSGNKYNTKITVTVPINAPSERYDLILKTATGTVISHGAVKVVKAFQDNYYIMHMSDGHIYQSGYDEMNLFSRKSTMIDMANIMDCEIIIETGDNMYNVRNHPEREVAYFQGFENLGINGMADASAATFLLPGDHEGLNANDFAQGTDLENSDFFNDYWGMQSSYFKYGNGRFMMLNNAWRSSETSGGVFQYQTDDAIKWLKADGAGGNFFVSAGHCYNKMHEFIDSYQNLDLVLAGDKHHVRTDNPFEFDPGKAKIAYIAGAIRDHFEFNLFRVDNVAGTFTPVSGTNSVVNPIASGDIKITSSWVKNLTLTYQVPNNGSVLANTATIENKFNFPILGAKVRFVMPKGTVYKVTKGTIQQEFEGTDFYIVDVKVDIESNSTTEIAIHEGDLCPNDPEKEDPQLCGCGVVEGTCVTSGLTVINGTGTGQYYPYEDAYIKADVAPDGYLFDKWVINSGSPLISKATSPNTVLKLGGVEASITATYKQIPLVNNASFVTQVIPEYMIPGAKATISITMNNKGTTTWTKADAYKLGSQNPQNNDIWGITRVELDENESIKPGENKVFVFEVTVPSVEGIYNFQWQMIQENVEWFGNSTTNYSTKLGESGDYLDDCELLTSWNSSSEIKLNSQLKKQGENCIEFTGTGIDEFSKVYSTPYVSGGSTTGTELRFWYYVSDIAQFSTNNQVEIGSSGVPDSNEYNWNLTGLKSGWNYVVLKVSNAGKIGTPNLNAINWFRIYRFKYGSVTTRIDGIQLLDPTKGEKFKLNINNGSGTGVYYYNTTFNIVANEAPEGEKFVEWIVNEGNASITNPGNLTTSITTGNVPSTISATYKSITESIDDTESGGKSVNIYPNPFKNGLLYLDLNGYPYQNKVNVKITNLLGKVVYDDSFDNKQNLTIDLEHLLKKAIYLVSVKTGNSIVNTKLIVL